MSATVLGFTFSCLILVFVNPSVLLSRLYIVYFPERQPDYVIQLEIRGDFSMFLW